MKHFSQEEIKKAQEVIKLTEEKQERMKKVKKEIASTLKQLEGKFAFKFSKNQVIFSTFTCGNVFIGVANCNSSDKFNSDLGKLIAIRKALGKKIDDVVDLVEPKKSSITWNSSGFYVTAPTISWSVSPSDYTYALKA